MITMSAERTAQAPPFKCQCLLQRNATHEDVSKDKLRFSFALSG